MAMRKYNNYLISILFVMLSYSCGRYYLNDKSVEGTYEDYGQIIHISGDTLVIKYNDRSSILDNVILAECEMTPIGGDFYSLFSRDVPMIAFENETIDYVEREQCETPTVTFRFPNYENVKTNPIKIIIESTMFARNEKYICDSCEFSIILPDKGLWEFKVALAPSEYFTVNAFDNYTGLLLYRDYYKRYDVRTQNMIITLPNVTEEIFDRWFFNNTIIRISDDKLLLEGSEFKKLK